MHSALLALWCLCLIWRQVLWLHRGCLECIRHLDVFCLGECRRGEKKVHDWDWGHQVPKGHCYCVPWLSDELLNWSLLAILQWTRLYDVKHTFGLFSICWLFTCNMNVTQAKGGYIVTVVGLGLILPSKARKSLSMGLFSFLKYVSVFLTNFPHFITCNVCLNETKHSSCNVHQ